MSRRSHVAIQCKCGLIRVPRGDVWIVLHDGLATHFLWWCGKCEKFMSIQLDRSEHVQYLLLFADRAIERESPPINETDVEKFVAELDATDAALIPEWAKAGW